MELLQTVTSSCPCCGEPLELVIDCSQPEQRYVEDCAVCCQPMVVEVQVEDGEVRVSLEAEGR
ncbi:MAG TPA: CPXCG motif-containing cysteine-rich protein [Spongiibacteraceae bacterium]|jgi:hypothetical protein|nr:CPXCG motif-containing cysteine-rich protein [Spongiibacteraceae bacterium]HUH37478.1 CPXCG motif-containing cysteine-rich protein [Spongiibacteraceae bacterium]